MLKGYDARVMEIVEYFGIPKRCTEFHIHAKVDEIVTVECTFYPEPESKFPVTKRFMLQELPED